MELTHTIVLDPNDSIEEFEINSDNLAEITVQVKGESTPAHGEGYRVVMLLSATAMVGLGTMLIRNGLAAQGIGDAEFEAEPLTPIISVTPDYNDMGIHLVPSSADLMIFLKDHGTYETILKNKE